MRTPLANILPLALGVLLSSFCFAQLGTLFAAYPTDNPGDIISMVNLVRFPLIFISGVFIPLAALPSFGQIIAFLSPLTYANDLIQGGYLGKTHLDPLIDIAVLFGFILLFQLIANQLYKQFND